MDAGSGTIQTLCRSCASVFWVRGNDSQWDGKYDEDDVQRLRITEAGMIKEGRKRLERKRKQLLAQQRHSDEKMWMYQWMLAANGQAQMGLMNALNPDYTGVPHTSPGWLSATGFGA